MGIRRQARVLSTGCEGGVASNGGAKIYTCVMVDVALKENRHGFSVGRTGKTRHRRIDGSGHDVRLVRGSR